MLNADKINMLKELRKTWDYAYVNIMTSYNIILLISILLGGFLEYKYNVTKPLQEYVFAKAKVSPVPFHDNIKTIENYIDKKIIKE